MSYEVDYIEYVETQLSIYKGAVELIRNGSDEITPPQINRALGEYTQVQLALMAEYKRKQSDLEKLETKFQLWWDEKFCEMRRQLNPTTAAASKWLSKTEIESETRVANKEDYLEKKEEIQELEVQVSFLRNILDSWKRHGDILVSLSHNMRTELNGLYVENRANETVKKERKIRQSR